ncbi:S41 family peptidase [Flavobacterium sp. SUN052]|uniref:S41 family peptidase n=1 Tax=Flavobacterium sp. SUN052 TaxID=3002441 RepID=UPI00237EA721|nr:S41 family peptidase [Flavobacterium sp. SUN052]MEC4005174.1 S41 family peptidase [Flavobacterium sp. SUN052]
MKVPLLVIFLIPLFSFSQNEVKPCEIISQINTIIKDQHYRPKAIDDSLSVYVFESFLKELDKNNRLFTEAEINNLTKYKLKLDDNILENNCDFLNVFYTTYSNAISRLDGIIENLKKEPFDYNGKETIQFSKKAFPYLKDIVELKKAHKKSMLYFILNDISKTSKNKDSLSANFDKLSKISKEKIFEIYSCKISSLQLTKKEFNSKFIRIYCSYFDPHTEYFSESEKSSFLSAVSADNLTFGIMISSKDKDEMIVDAILPGSSAYFSEKIKVGDQILKIKYLNEEYPISCSSVKKVHEIFSSSEYKNVEFTLRKKSGETYTVNLVKKVLKDYDNGVYSYVIEKGGKKIGYLKIPSFYANFENGKTNVSDDVAKEIVKLQKDAIDGLIIDLQNNGGGSMNEAIKLSGSFIDIGPVAILKSRNNTETVKDPNRGSIFTGPIVILINGFSASASEFFSNAMQDYKRAIIIGAKSYGKASVQSVIPIKEGNNPDEYLKLTIQAFYRITGKSNQTTGITPDIEIPLLFDKQMPRESINKTALKNESVDAVLRFNEFSNPFRIDAIEASKKRINLDTNAKAISALNVRINKFYDFEGAPILLNFNSVFDEVSKLNLLWKEINTQSEIIYPINVERNSVDIENQQFDEYLKSSTTKRIKEIKTNLHITEAVNIINDLKK